jgi:hypothetical protein
VSAAEPFPSEQRVVKLFDIQGHYQEEFTENGLDNIQINKKTNVH